VDTWASSVRELQAMKVCILSRDFGSGP